MSDFNSRTVKIFSVGVMIAAAITTSSAPSDARVRFFGHTSHSVHSVRHRLHFHPFLHSSYPRSVLGHRPYVPYGSFCSVFIHHPCLPGINYPIGQDLQLTIESRVEDDPAETPAEKIDGDHVTHDLDAIREVYWDAITDAFKRCTPLQFTDGLGGALAGRPFAIRFVDNRSF